MPSIRQDSTVETIARAFCSNGRKQEQAMIDAGYSKAYANSYCGKLWENPRLRAAIRRIDDEMRTESKTTVTSVHSMYQEAYIQALVLNQPSAMVSAVTGIARLYGMDKDNQIAPDMPASITAAQADEYRGMAQAATRLRLSKETA